jgi:hypothetical protein
MARGRASPALDGRFDDHRRLRESGQHTIALGKGRERRVLRGFEWRDQRTAGCHDLFVKRAMLGRIAMVEPRAHDGHGDAPRVESAAVRGSVDAHGTA